MEVKRTRSKETKVDNMLAVIRLHNCEQLELFHKEFKKFHANLKAQGLDIGYENWVTTNPEETENIDDLLGVIKNIAELKELEKQEQTSSNAR